METERKFTIKPEEPIAHEESERRRREIEHRQVLEETSHGLEKDLTVEEIDAAKEKARQREETKPWGI